MTTLTDTAAQYAADTAASTTGLQPVDVLLKRAYMAGALEAARPGARP